MDTAIFNINQNKFNRTNPRSNIMEAKRLMNTSLLSRNQINLKQRLSPNLADNLPRDMTSALSNGSEENSFSLQDDSLCMNITHSQDTPVRLRATAYRAQESSKFKHAHQINSFSSSVNSSSDSAASAQETTTRNVTILS